MLWVSQNLQPDQLGVWLRGGASGVPLLLLTLCGGCLGCLATITGGGDAGAAAHVTDVEGEQLAIGYGELLHGLVVVGDEGAIMVEVLGGGVDAGFGVDGAAEGLEGHVREDFEGEEVLILGIGVCNTQCNPHLAYLSFGKRVEGWVVDYGVARTRSRLGCEDAQTGRVQRFRDLRQRLVAL